MLSLRLPTILVEPPRESRDDRKLDQGVSDHATARDRHPSELHLAARLNLPNLRPIPLRLGGWTHI